MSNLCPPESAQHFDDILVDELTDIDKASEIQAQAVQVEECLNKLIQSAESEKNKAETR